MADLQKQFERFEETIRIDREVEKAVLVEKRERILTRLRAGIAAQRVANVAIPSYRHHNQGSYAMETEVKPLDEDYDLDVAIIFDFDCIERPNPLVVKRWVHEAVKSHTTSVRWREPCVSVFYSKAGEITYHVDLAIYAQTSTATYLARGYENAPSGRWSWEAANPTALVELIRKRFSETDDQAQYRRTIRYLKRWKDLKFPSQGNEAPRGIALTACAHRWFTTQFSSHPEHRSRRPDDSAALLRLVDSVLAQFDCRGRISVTLPVEPGNDLFERMSDTQLATFRTKLRGLQAALTDAQADPDPHTAATCLAKVFGRDFPIPNPRL